MLENMTAFDGFGMGIGGGPGFHMHGHGGPGFGRHGGMGGGNGMGGGFFAPSTGSSSSAESSGA